ncbi:MAG: DUF362 domain-containing protein [Firmicutes bacterium]|nr:DUF362 domain-containing protein [Bacillota bacterium]
MERREFILWLIAAGLIPLELVGCGSKSPDGSEGDNVSAYEPKANPAANPPAGPAGTGGAGARGIGASKLVVANGSDPETLLDKGFAAMGGIAAWVRKGDVVAIKPNFSVPVAPDSGAVTDPRLVAGLVRRCLAQGAKEVKVIDYPFTNPAMCLERTGIKTAVEAAGGRLIVPSTLNDKFYRQVSLKGPHLKTAYFSYDVLEADLFISFPILKHHGSTKLTMSLKNMMGLVWNRQALHSSNLDASIPELTAFKQPHLIIMDAIRGITEKGPRGPGNIREYNQLIFGTDPVAVDAYGAELFGLKPTDVRHLKAAADMGLGQIDWGKLPLVKA